MSNRLDQDREQKLQPVRMAFAKSEIEKLGYEIVSEDSTKIKFYYKGAMITLYPYSGWHTGKNIKDGRGIEKLINQIK